MNADAVLAMVFKSEVGYGVCCDPIFQDTPMRSPSALFILGFAAAGLLASSPAHAYNRRYCMIGNGYSAPGYCAYDTYAQCQASASGFAAYCNVNPRYTFAQPGSRHKHRDGWNLSPFLFGNGGPLQ